VHKSLSTKVAVAILGALLYFLTVFSPFFLWIAPLPLLLLAIQDRKVTSYLLIFFAYLIGNFSGGYYTYFGTIFPIYASLLPTAIESLFFTLILWITATCLHRFQSWYSAFVFPTLWVSFLFLQIQFISKGDITDLPIFSQVEFLPILQIVSITGPLGLSFLTALFPSCLLTFWHFRKIQALIPLLLFVPVLLFGFFQLQPTSLPHLKVGLAAKNPPDLKSFLATRDRDPIGRAHEFADAVHKLAGKGAKYILQPEKTLWVTPENQTEIFQILADAAQSNQVYVFAPMGLVNRPLQTNSISVFAPNGNLIAQYSKMHPVEGFEDRFTAGKDLLTLPLAQGLIGFEICHDMDFFQPIRAYSEKGVGILFVPAEDFAVQADGKWHSQVAILQSVAAGVSLARAAYFGYLSGSDAQGRILAWEPTSSGNEVLAVFDIPFGQGRSFYARTGNWFGWLNCLIALLFLGLIFKPKTHYEKNQ